MPQVGIRELKNDTSEILRAVREEKAEYLVTHRGKPVAVILPVDVELSPELTERIEAEAQRRGLSVDQFLQHLLEHETQFEQRQADAVALLQTWIDTDDPDEQKATGEYLVQALDADRPSSRPLFPPDKEGVSW